MVKLLYKKKFGKKLNLKNPQTYSEKLQWLKLYDKNPLYTKLVDKYEVKNYVAEKFGEDLIIPTLGVWDKFEDIDFNQLPDQFVLKTAHDSGGIYICKDKSKIDFSALSKFIKQRQKVNPYYSNREWPYKNVKPRVIAEKFMIDESGEGLKDYKFFCFNGKVKAMFIATDRNKEGTEVKFDFFDRDFKHLPFKQGHENAEITPNKPAKYEEMVAIAERLSEGFCQVRVDLYNINGKIYFGEYTFFHFSGTQPFVPECWDKTFGDWITLPQKRS